MRTSDEWNKTSDPTAMLEAIQGVVDDSLFRRFACACCRRIEDLVRYDEVAELLSLAERHASAEPVNNELDAVGSRVNCIYDSLYPGYGSPSAEVMAIVAISSAAHTTDAHRCAVLASQSAAEALALQAAHGVTDARYDAAHKERLAAEFVAQANLLRELIHPPVW